MDREKAKRYYSRKDIQEAILRFSKNREIAFQYGLNYGKRPDTIEYISDIKFALRRGFTSIHASEERWANPLLLESLKTEEEKKKNRIGWDLILDLDGADFIFAKLLGETIINYLKNELKIKNISVKFSGNKGFHIGIPFEAFSSEIVGIGKTKHLFPEAPKKISLFLMKELETKIVAKILKKYKTIENISKEFKIPIEELILKDKEKTKLNYLKLIEIDTILITSRHLFRMPYSFNEKSELISIPIKPERIIEFNKEEAKPENVQPKKYKKYEFLKYNPKHKKDADILLIKAFEEINEETELTFITDLNKIKQRHIEITANKKSEFQSKIIFGISQNLGEEIYEITETVDETEFPETIKYILNHKLSDGKKRALFVLLTFFTSINYKYTDIEQIIEDWNRKQEKPLPKKYIDLQISWFKKQKHKISPPNYEHKKYYQELNIPEEIINRDINYFSTKEKKIKIKNPLHYTYKKLKIKKLKKRTKKTIKKKENK